MGISAATLEQNIHLSNPDTGYHDQFVIPLGAWRNKDATALTGASTPAATNLLTNEEIISWAANAAVTVQAAVKFSMPDNYAFLVGNPGRAAATVDTAAILDDDIKLICNMRRQRAAADTGAWAARATVFWYTPGTTAASLTTFTTNPTAAVPTIAADNTAALTGFARLTFDIGARLRAEGRRILPGDEVRVLIGPDAANANAALQMTSSLVQYRRHMGLRDLRLRGIL